MGTLFHNHNLLSTLDDKERRKVIGSILYPDLTFQDNSKTKGKDILLIRPVKMEGRYMPYIRRTEENYC